MPLSQAKPQIPTATAPMFLFDPDASQSEDGDLEDEDDEDEGRSKKKRKGPATAKGKKAAEDTARRKIEIGYIVKKEKRHITFSKRKAGIMKKVSSNSIFRVDYLNVCCFQAYELSTLTGTQVLLLVVSESGIVSTLEQYLGLRLTIFECRFTRLPPRNSDLWLESVLKGIQAKASA